MSGKQIDAKLARKAMLAAQKGAVSTWDITDIFMPRDLYEKFATTFTRGDLVLSNEERLQVKYALTAMANTFLDLAPYVAKQIKRKSEWK